MAAKPKGLQKHIDAIKKMDGKSVEAGWFETNRYPDGTSVAQVARFNEFGTTKAPARPFMRLAASKFSAQRKEAVPKLATKMAEGKITADQALGAIGNVLEGCIVDSIKNGGWTPNAPSTVEKKGFDKPLIDTGEMFKSVSSKVS